MNPLPLFGVGLLAVCLLMSLLWVRQRATNNAGIVDVGWAGSIGALGVVFALVGDGWWPRQLAAALMAGIWGARLAWHIHERAHGKPEDGRYAQLRRDWAPNVQPRMFAFFQLQALVAAVFALPFLLAAHRPEPFFQSLEIAAMALWLVATLGEGLADAQLRRFKRYHAGSGRVCDAGLWRFSRHPNYFFESLVWCANALFATTAAFGWIAWLCPALILYFLLRVTGIPATEEQALRTKGEAYRDYQRRTSAFIPWFPRKIAHTP